MALPDILNYVPDPKNGRPIADGKVYFLVAGYDAPLNDADIDESKFATLTALGVTLPQPIYTSKGGTLLIGSQTNQPEVTVSGVARVAVYDKCGKLVYSKPYFGYGTFVEIDALAATDSNVLVGGVEAGTLVARIYGWVTPQEFGAVGDGVADDTAAILAANATGKPIYFQKTSGYYKVTSPLTISSPLIAGIYNVFGSDGNIKLGLRVVDNVFPEWFGARREADGGAFDSTAAIQAAIDSYATLNASSAINEGVTLHAPVKFGAGVYYSRELSVNHPIRFIGSGMKNTMLKLLVNTGNMFNITTLSPVEFYDLSFGAADFVGPLIAGSLISYNPTTGANEYSKIERCAFNNCFGAIDFVSALHINVSDCYFQRFTNFAIKVSNDFFPDGGDSTITGCTFNNFTSIAIYQTSSGGLRIVNNKFLGGNYHYLGEYNSGFEDRTGQLIIANNSFDQCNIANVAFSRIGDSVFSIILINSNIFVPSANCTAVKVEGYSGQSFLSNMTIGNNVFYMRDTAKGVSLASCGQISIHPNHFMADGGTTTTAITLENGFPLSEIIINPQSMNSVSTPYAGQIASANFVAGENLNFAGDPNNNVSPQYIGQELLDTTNNKWYKSFGLAGNQWAALN